VLDDRIPHRQGLVDVDQQAQGRVVARAQLDHPRDADEIDPGAEIEAADDGRAGQDDDRHVLVLVNQGMGNGQAAPEMAQTEGIVRINKDAHVLVLGLVIGHAPHPPKAASGQSMA
jgi:hypothetical protein